MERALTAAFRATAAWRSRPAGRGIAPPLSRARASQGVKAFKVSVSISARGLTRSWPVVGVRWCSVGLAAAIGPLQRLDPRLDGLPGAAVARGEPLEARQIVGAEAGFDGPAWRVDEFDKRRPLARFGPGQICDYWDGRRPSDPPT